MKDQATLECDDCGLIYEITMLNLVDAVGDERKESVSNHCPNCAGENLKDWEPTNA